MLRGLLKKGLLCLEHEAYTHAAVHELGEIHPVKAFHSSVVAEISINLNLSIFSVAQAYPYLNASIEITGEVKVSSSHCIQANAEIGSVASVCSGCSFYLYVLVFVAGAGKADRKFSANVRREPVCAGKVLLDARSQGNP